MRRHTRDAKRYACSVIIEQTEGTMAMCVIEYSLAGEPKRLISRLTNTSLPTSECQVADSGVFSRRMESHGKTRRFATQDCMTMIYRRRPRVHDEFSPGLSSPLIANHFYLDR